MFRDLDYINEYFFTALLMAFLSKTVVVLSYCENVVVN